MRDIETAVISAPMRYLPKQPRTAAELFAALASIPDDVRTLGPAEQVRLYDSIVRLYGPLKHWSRRLPRDAKAHAGNTLFIQLHLVAREWIAALLDGKDVRPDDHEYPRPRPIWRLLGDRLIDREETPEQAMYSGLIALLHERPFPFRHCPDCGRIFVREGKRRYCSPRCTKRANDRSRYNANRKAYLTGYTKLWRAEKAALVESGGRVTKEVMKLRAMRQQLTTSPA